MEEFKSVYNAHIDRIFFYVSAQVDSREDAEDIVQEIFLRLWSYRYALKDAEKAEAILYKTARQEVANFYRRQKRYHNLQDNQFLESISSQSPDYEEREQAATLQKISFLLGKLPERTREILLRSKVGSDSYAHIAEDLKISKSGVEKHIRKALNFLRSNLDKTLVLVFFLESFMLLFFLL